MESEPDRSNGRTQARVNLVKILHPDKRRLPRKWVKATLTLTLMNYGHRVLGLLSLLSIITYLDRIGIAVAGPRMQD